MTTTRDERHAIGLPRESESSRDFRPVEIVTFYSLRGQELVVASYPTSQRRVIG